MWQGYDGRCGAAFDRLAPRHHLSRFSVDGRRTAPASAVRAQSDLLRVETGLLGLLPTNARLMRPDVIDRIADAGVATVNFAVDAVDEKLGLPKALVPVRRYFDYLIHKTVQVRIHRVLQHEHLQNNIGDIRQLTGIAHDNGIATDYHINESPMIEQDHFQHYDNNDTYIRQEDWPQVDELINWLIEKNKSGYRMVNSVKRLNDMRDFMKGKVEPWNCRAGQNSLIIRVDGSLAPCFPMYSAKHDWGRIEKAQVRGAATQRDEVVVPDALLLYAESQSGLLLQRRPGDQVDDQAPGAGFQGRYRELCSGFFFKSLQLKL